MMTKRGTGRVARLLLLAAAMAVAVTTGCSDERSDDVGRTDSDPPTDTAAAGSTGPGAEPPATPAVEEMEVGDPGFYDVPDPLPEGSPGDLFRVQPIEGAPDGAEWYRIFHLSETIDGNPTAVTGVLTLPVGEPPSGGWPLFAHAHGSTGLADPCAPSVSLDDDGLYAIELSLLSPWAARDGFALVSTDYEGLGGPGVHPLLIGGSEGRSVLDSIRSVRGFPGATFEERVGIIGYSQGGHAAAWANELAPTYAPELDIIGVLAGSPATEVGLAAEGDEATQLILAAALTAASDEFDVTDIATETGMELVEQLDQVCQGQYSLEGDGPLVTVDVTTTEPWATGLAGSVPGHDPGAAPVLIVHSQEDLSVPVDRSRTFMDRLCVSGGVVERRVLESGDHVSAAVPSYEQGIAWIRDLAEGSSPTDECPG